MSVLEEMDAIWEQAYADALTGTRQPAIYHGDSDKLSFYDYVFLKHAKPLSIVEQLAVIAADAVNIREIEYELALAIRAAPRNDGGRINWSRAFSWLRPAIAKSQDYRCCWCGVRTHANARNPNRRPTFEHVIPLSAGGEDAPSNLKVACYGCNYDRSNARLAA